MFRTEEEVNVLVRLVDWDEVEEGKVLDKVLTKPRSRSAKSQLDASKPDSTPQRGTGRIDMDAFERLIDPTSDLDTFIVGCGGVDEEGMIGDLADGNVEGDCYHWLLDLSAATPEGSDSRLGGTEEEDWRPMSPDHSGTSLGLYDSVDFYEF